MKSILMIGMGQFGHHLCGNLLKLGNEIMVVDRDENKVKDLIYKVTNVQIGDCTDPEVVKSLEVSSFDMVLICIGDNFQSSLEITSLVKEMGGRYVISKADRDVHARFLLRNGADEVIYPERDIAERFAKKISSDEVFDYIELDSSHSIYEITPLPEWIGHTIKEMHIRERYAMNIVGVKKDGKVNILPPVNYIFNEEDHLMVLGEIETVEKLLKL